jgi:hypothetical protein
VQTLPKLTLSLATAGFLFCVTPPPIAAQTAREPIDLDRRFARHFAEGPPLHFEIEQHGEHAPRVVITNMHHWLLTAYVVQTEPKSAEDTAQTLICDALTHVGLLTPIPSGLSNLMGVPHVVGGRVPDAKVVAAVWEDGSTFGPDDLLAQIFNNRKTLAHSYDLAIATLQTGLEKNWSVQEYLNAAQMLRPPMPPQAATLKEAKATSEKFTAETLPSYAIADTMRHAVQSDRSPARVTKLAQTLLKSFEQSRDSLRQALGGTT